MYVVEIMHHNCYFSSESPKGDIFSKIIPSFLTFKEGSTFLIKPLFNGLYIPFGYPVSGGQKPQEREDVTALRCSEPLRYKVGGPIKGLVRLY